MVAERLPGPAAASMAEEAEWLEGEACPAPCSTQRESCAEPCHGGETGSEQRPRAEVQSRGPTEPPQNPDSLPSQSEEGSAVF